MVMRRAQFLISAMQKYYKGADFDYVISRLAPIGEKMAVLLA